jgi:hypothetical protein
MAILRQDVALVARMFLRKVSLDSRMAYTDFVASKMWELLEVPGNGFFWAVRTKGTCFNGLGKVQAK